MSLAACAGETNECVSILINPFNACCSRNQLYKYAIYKYGIFSHSFRKNEATKLNPERLSLI